MDTEEVVTESQVLDKKALAAQRFKDSLVASQDEADAEAFDRMTAMVKGVAGRTTTAQANVIDAAAEVAPSPNPKRAYGSAGRAHPAQLSDYRYRCLPKWQQEFRNPEDDMIIARYFRALGLNDHAAMARLMDEDRHSRADLEEGNSTTGGPFSGTAGQLLPLPVSNFINIALYRMARFRGLVNTTTTTTGASLRIPRQNAISSSTWEAESAGLGGDQEPTVSANLNLQLQKLTTLATLSNEVLEDEVFGIVNWLINDVTMQIAETEDEALYGSGAGAASEEPNGFEANDIIITATTDNVNILPTATQAANHFLPTEIDYQSVIALFFSIGEKERGNAIFSGPDTVMQILSTVEDGSGRPIFNMQNSAVQIVGDDASGGQVGSILGRPVVNLPGAEGVVDSNSNRLYFFNPMRSYAILERANIRIEASRENLFDTDQTRYRFVRRVDGGVIGNTIAGRSQFRFIGGITGPGTPA